jgi:O-antigen ligase
MSHDDSTPPSARVSHLELAAVAHVGAMVLFAGAAFGGNIWWARAALTVWGLGGGVAIAALALAQRGDAGREARARVWVLAPWAALCLLALVSCLNPSFRAVTIGGERLLLHEGGGSRWLPSTASPAATLRELAFFSGAWLAACNLWLVVRSRRLLRRLLAVAAAGAFVLAVFGILQSLLAPSAVQPDGPRAGWFTGFYFGAALSPQKRFFATFIYNNHWGGFLVLWLAVATGLLFRLARRARGRNLWHTPFAVLLAGALLMAAAAPASASRAATAMAAALCLAALGVTLVRLAAARRRQGRSAGPVIAVVLAVALAFVAAVGWLAARPIRERLRDTREGLAADPTLLRARFALYRDTWTLAAQKPVFGWGLGSYPVALQLLPGHDRPSDPRRDYELSYANAHSDWLQSVAEIGFVGTTLLVLMGALPLARLPRGAWRHPLTGWPLLGCTLVALYAWVEFPFGNGAVMISFWTIFFAALRLAELQRRAALPAPEVKAATLCRGETDADD